MKLKKIISSSLIAGFLFNSGSLSLASILSEDGRYETFEGNSINIANVLEDDKIDVEIEGNTMVNLIDSMDNLWNFIIKKKDQYQYVDGDLIIPNNGYFHGWYWNNLNPIPNIKGNTTYTLIFTKGISPRVELGWVNEEGVSNSYKTFYNVDKISFTSPRNGDLRIKYCVQNPSSDSSSINLGKVMLLEGDWTDKELPKYFEGMKSVGQDDENGHKIEILSRNDKLIINKDKLVSEGTFYYTKGWDAIRLETKAKKVKIVVTNKDGLARNTKLSVKNDIESEARLTSLFALNTSFDKIEKDYNLVDTNILSFCVYGENRLSGNFFDFYDIEVFSYDNIEETTSTAKYDKKEILLNEPLRGLQNGVKDKIVKRNGQWVVERNCKEIILDGTENWSIGTESNGWTIYDDSLVVYTDSYAPKANSRYMCDKLPYIGGSGVCTQNIVGTSNQTWGSMGHISIRVPCSYLETENINGFKQWLSKNNLKIVYQLESPVYEPLNIDSTLDLYLDTTYVSNNSNIPANIKIVIDRTMNKAVEAIELAKLDPTTENLSDARYWTNLLKESTKKDELQSVITNIVGPSDIELERKTVSVNTDVYVKSENMLSMSLSTNSVSFNDYSGVEDMEILNAVNITINSSLPYNLNAYMPNEIISSNSSKIDKEVLNIRDNSEEDYQNFDNNTNKLVLKDGCAEGNNKQHSIDLKLKSDNAHTADIYRTVIKFEAEQK